MYVCVVKLSEKILTEEEVEWEVIRKRVPTLPLGIELLPSSIYKSSLRVTYYVYGCKGSPLFEHVR